MALRILVCDDSATARRFLVRSIPPELMAEVVEVDRGLKAVAAYRDKRADLVLLDLTMPEMSGFEVLEELRRFDPTARIVVVSADIQEEARRRVMTAGARAYVAKPVNPEEVRRLISEHV